jgi:signal peptidase II
LRRSSIFAITLTAVLILDQVTKRIVSGKMMLGESIPLIKGALSLTYIRNSGIAFGLLQGGGAMKTVFLAVFSILAILFLFWMLTGLDRDDLFGATALGLVAGGAFGNLVDRFTGGDVVDFIDAYWKGHHWPAFNVADSCITVGVILLLVKIFFFEDKRTGEEG